MVALQRATALGTDINLIPKASESFTTSFTSSTRNIWINSLWLASLALTLSVALVAGLVQQWLNYYVADITGHSPKKQACIRYYRYTGLKRWNVPAIIELLPVLMNASLFLFLIGLILFTRDLTGMNAVGWFLVTLTGALFLVYAGMSFLPIWSAQCPYKTSLSKVFIGSLYLIYLLLENLGRSMSGLQPVSNWLPRMKRTLKETPKRILRWLTHVVVRESLKQMERTTAALKDPRWRNRLSLRLAEDKDVADNIVRLQQGVVTDLALKSTNPSVPTIAVQALAGYHIFDLRQITVSEPLLELYLGQFKVEARNASGNKLAVAPGQRTKLERYARAYEFLHTHPTKERVHGFHAYIYHDIILQALSPPSNLNEALLLRATGFYNVQFRIRLDFFIDYLHSQEPIPLSRVHRWRLSQFLGKIREVSLDDVIRKWDKILLGYVLGLSGNGELTLQETVAVWIYREWLSTKSREPDSHLSTKVRI